MTYGSYGVFLGDRSNNEAEYEAFLQAVTHAQRDLHTFIIFRVDSMLIYKQMNGLWACRSNNLLIYYERALSLLQPLRDRGATVQVEHVYREFNSDADGIANEVLDLYDEQVHRDRVVVSVAW